MKRVMDNFRRKYLDRSTSIAPLVVFRILFGLMMLVSIIRFAWKGWIADLYVAPEFFFTFYGFGWVKPWGPVGMYVLFATMGIAAVLISLGWFYRVASLLFFLAFTYVELIDKTNYLNHYYFVSIVSFLLIFVPANRSFSLDVHFNPRLKVERVPAWTINIFRLQLGIVYFYAGLAKLNTEWLLRAMPLRIWLPAQSHLPVVGYLFNYKLTAYLFSWFGAAYDLTIPFLLSIRYTRVIAYVAVILFHVMTAVLFKIGMFPFIMILATLLFFPAGFHERIIRFLQKIMRIRPRRALAGTFVYVPRLRKILTAVLIIHFTVQLLLPFRYLLYPGNLFWNEQGYRFSWRVMLMEKAGYVVFHVYDSVTGKKEQVNNYDYLTKNQEKMMSTQPDMILQFAHFLEEKYREKGFIDPQITVESYVTLNGRRSQPFIDPNRDLTKIGRSWQTKDWVLSPSW